MPVHRILFLDVDGVLNTYRSQGLFSISNGPLERLRQIVKDTDCSIVLSSTWRKDPRAMAELQRRFKYKGIPNWVGVTPVHDDGYRGLEIAAYLQSVEFGKHEKDTYAILDDDSDMMDHQLRHFFQTDPEYGLTKTIAYRVTYHLLNGVWGQRVSSTDGKFLNRKGLTMG